jgi:hypothetical protein
MRSILVFSYALALAIAGALGAARPAAAQSATPVQFFLGGDLAAALFGDYEESPGDDVDDADLSWIVFGGVRYGYVGASFGYTDFGELKASGPANGGFVDEIDYDGYTLVAHGFLPLGDRFILTAEGGALFWDQSVRYVDALGKFRAKETGTSGLVGVGAGYQIVPEMGISLTFRYTHYFSVGSQSETGHDSDIDRIGVGVAVNF